VADKIPVGAIMNKALTIKTGQTHVQAYHDELLARIEKGEIDPSFIITHTVPIDKGPDMYKTFRDKDDGCIKEGAESFLRALRASSLGRKRMKAKPGETLNRDQACLRLRVTLASGFTTLSRSASGWFSAISSRRSEAPSGSRTPCSHACTVLLLTFSMPANTGCETFSRARTRRTRSAS
jgi:hypothetical protein